MKNEEKLITAIRQKDIALVQVLLNHDPALLQQNMPGNISLLMFAAYQRDPELAQAVRPFVRQADIFEAAAIGMEEVVMEEIKRNPILVNSYSPDGFPLLTLACFFGHVELAKSLVESHADVEQVSDNPMKVYALHSAAAAPSLELVSFLLSYGAQPNVRQAAGVTPLHTAAQAGNLDMVHLLLIHGANPDALMDDGRSAIDMAEESEKDDIADLLRSLRN
ncbi:MAG: ankyrin repeat domain-containing protein [Bacteroidota bacterium]